jgi:soluble lytic murein transglycosylase-like protein
MALVLAAALAAAQTSADFEARVRAAMASSLEKQKAAVQKQVTTATTATAETSAGFFTVPWPAPVAASFECDPMPKADLDPLIEDAARQHGLEAQLVRAVIDKESAARPCAVSMKGAQGLMQLMPATAEQFGVRDPFDPKQNLEAGATLLKQLLTRYNGDVSLALGAYNAGPARVDREGGVPPIQETLRYVTDIMARAALP